MRWVFLFVALLVSGPCQAQNMILLGAGSTKKVAASTYQGPGDIKTGAFAWYSCARAYNAAYAVPGTNKACDVVDTSTGLTTCTFHIKTTGFVDPTECNATACATACSVKTAYDQSGNSRDITNATLAQMPPLTLSMLGGLPGISCASGSTCFIQSANFTAAQPLNLSTVAERIANFTTTFGVIGSGTSSQDFLGFSSSANNAAVVSTSVLAKSATDSAFHAINALASGASSAINIDGGTDSTGTIGTTGISAAPIRWMRSGGISTEGASSMEAGIWQGSAFTQSDRQALSANQHGSNGYSF